MKPVLRALWRSPGGRAGCVLIGLVVLGAVLAAVGATPYAAETENPLSVLKGPSPSHPSVAIVVAVIGFNFLGDGLRDAFDPRART